MDACIGLLVMRLKDENKLAVCSVKKSELPTMILNGESKEHSVSRFACVQGDSCDFANVRHDEDLMKKDTEAFEIIKTLPFSSDQCLKFQIDVKITGV